MKIQFFNHACFSVEDKNVLLLSDPYLSGTAFNNGWDLILEDIYFISECNNFRSKNFFKLNNGIFCYIFNLLYYIGIFRFRRFSSSKENFDKLNYFSIAAVYKK